jgi:PAS domain S-box-containing protein
MPGKHGICVFDSNCVITHINRAAEEIVRFSPAEAVGRNISEVFPFFLFDGVHGNGSEPDETGIERRDGTLARVSYTAAPTGGGGGVLAIREIPLSERDAERLAELERESRLLFDQNPFPMWVYDVETLRFLDVNPAAIDHYGYSREEFLSMTLADLRPPEDVPAVIDAVRRNAKAFRAQGRWRHRLRNGRTIVVDVTSTATTYRRRPAKLAVVHDVTDREESEAKVRQATALIDAVVNTVPLAIWGVDLEGKINFWNRKAEEMFGWREMEVLGLPAPWAADEGAGTGKRSPAETERERVTGTERALPRKDGHVLHCESWSAPLRDGYGNRIGTVAVAADTTERKQAQEQLATYIKSLARSNDDLRQFAYAASHDLQEPLRNIRLFAELLSQPETGTGDEHAQSYLTHVLQGAKQIQELIRGLRKYWELGERPPDLGERIDGSSVVGKVIAALEGTLNGIGATIRYDVPAVLAGSEQELRTVFQELLNNAVRFRSRRPLDIEISAVMLRPGMAGSDEGELPSIGGGGNVWQICVRDNGLGLAPVYATKIFGIFKRLTREGEGIGLGLALVKRIVERHGGRVWVESEQGQGSRFYFIWPGA